MTSSQDPTITRPTHLKKVDISLSEADIVKPSQLENINIENPQLKAELSGTSFVFDVERKVPETELLDSRSIAPLSLDSDIPVTNNMSSHSLENKSQAGLPSENMIAPIDIFKRIINWLAHLISQLEKAFWGKGNVTLPQPPKIVMPTIKKTKKKILSNGEEIEIDEEQTIEEPFLTHSESYEPDQIKASHLGPLSEGLPPKNDEDT